MYLKSLAQRRDRVLRPQPVDYREPLSEFDIKSAVDFLGFRSPFQGVGVSSSSHAAIAVQG